MKAIFNKWILSGFFIVCAGISGSEIVINSDNDSEMAEENSDPVITGYGEGFLRLVKKSIAIHLKTKMTGLYKSRILMLKWIRL
ncbi:hypothetical protein DYD21_17295 [Rhodohalobacter sp. SW132]|uniref:hypothetical protein n=1 Tax=Rhodohalobacter sp. SW132 TaxID=2293433 RepID=UPI000E273C27|nr:hypothetical protein [Rhodohalobacter sp. SW132]REL24621.1 hypothetical protein DYD21_17295 [Rhodohalobacter sp. SW132]